jgi:glycosyltransferase involved in cell wall biosynthesis
MKILYLTAGGSVHDQRFLRKFVQSKHTFYYVYLHDPGEKYAEPGIPSYCLGFDDTNPKGFLTRVWATFRCYWRFRRLLRQLKPDILHVGPVNSAGLFVVLSGFHPVLLMAWGSDILVLPETKGVLYRMMARYIIRRSDMIACDAVTVKNRILELTHFPPDRIVVFPWGIDLHQFHPSLDKRKEARSRLGFEDSRVILMNRSFAPVYGVEFFLRALPRVSQRVKNARVLLIGDGPLKADLLSLVRELYLENVVRFMGEVSNSQMAAYLNAADLYVSTSLSDGTSTSLLEAMACGIPVVISDAPANLEWVKDGENGFFVPRRNVERIADRIVEILQNEPLARRMGELNLKIAYERADWDKNYATLEGMYSELETRFNLTVENARSERNSYHPDTSTSINTGGTSDD